MADGADGGCGMKGTQKKDNAALSPDSIKGQMESGQKISIV